MRRWQLGQPLLAGTVVMVLGLFIALGINALIHNWTVAALVAAPVVLLVTHPFFEWWQRHRERTK